MNTEILLQTVIIVFMLFLCAMCLFAIMVIVRDIIAESSSKHRKEDKVVKEVSVIKEVSVPVMSDPAACESCKAVASQPIPAPQVTAVPEPEVVVKPEPMPEPEVVVVAEPTAVPEPTEQPPSKVVTVEDENAVKFSTNQQTMKDKYAMLSKEYKGYFDAIAKHALSKEGAKIVETKSYYDYKLGSNKLVRMSIKRGEIYCEFVFIDRNFKSYASQADLKIKSTGSVIKVVEPAAVGVAKDGIDLVISQIKEEKEFKRQMANEKRRAKRLDKQAKEKEAKEKETVNV